MSAGECKGKFKHNWHVRKFGGAYCTRCSIKAERFCNVNGKPVVNHCDIDFGLPVKGESK